MRLILASGSPRRQQLLEEAGYDFTIEPADVDEERLAAKLDAKEVPQALAEAKADRVARQHVGERVVVIGADTVVYSSTGDLLGKPVDRDDARRMMRILSNSVHQVVTGYAAVRCDDGRRVAGRVRSDVTMRPITDEQIEAFLDTTEWQGKAGGYGIQDGPGGPDPFVEEVGGELTNVVGLPMPQIVDALRDLGVRRRLDD